MAAFSLFRSRASRAAAAAEEALATLAGELLRANRRKIVYGITPPRTLANVGDQAQAVAIHRWFRRHFPEFGVIEVDKNLSGRALRSLREAMLPGDLVFLHSGGNLGDRGMWSERARRNMIDVFRDFPVVSLPQTVYFSDTPVGREERAKTAALYAVHPRLTVLGRDRASESLARELFSRARVGIAPDFVLSLASHRRDVARAGTLLCLRDDTEGILNASDKARLAERLAPARLYDTTLPVPIPPEQRAAFLEEALDLFASHEAVVTDRFHGVIFSVLTRTPCVVLRTVDHKLSSAIEWFDAIPFVRMAKGFDEVPASLEATRAARRDDLPDFEALYFAPLARELRRLYVDPPDA